MKRYTFGRVNPIERMVRNMHLRDILPNSVMMASRSLHLEISYDVFMSPNFWEHWIAVQLGGRVTPHKCNHDVDVSIWGKKCAAEIKFSNAYKSKYNPIRGKSWDRNVFKWAVSETQINNPTAHAFILVGLDADRSLHTWVVPNGTLSKSNTICAPSSRKGGLGKLDKYKCDPYQILNAFANIAHEEIFKHETN